MEGLKRTCVAKALAVFAVASVTPLILCADNGDNACDKRS